MARILFIEPDRILGANAVRIMKLAGHLLDWQVDPQVAIDSADSSHPDIIVLDLLLAGRSGVEFLYEFRSYPEWSDVPAIIYSNVPADEFGAENTSFGHLNIVAYHYKPATPIAKLLKSIEKNLQPPTEFKSVFAGRVIQA